MPRASRAHLESLLRAKKLDRTLTSSCSDGRASMDPAAIGIGQFDAHLRGGFPRGEVSEVIGGPTSGRTTLLLQALTAATYRDEFVTLVDTLDRLDVSSAVAAGLDLDRTLWIRGRVTSHPRRSDTTNARAFTDILKTLSLVLQAGLSELVVLDVADAPSHAIRDLPVTTWLRLHRMIEGRRTACVLVSATPVWRSAGGLSVEMAADASPREIPVSLPTHARLFEGLTLHARVRRARTLTDAPLCVPVSATCA